MVQRLIEGLDTISYAVEHNVPIDILCTGSPDIIGDSFGPRVGTLLLDKALPGVNIIGCCSSPVNSTSIWHRLHDLRNDALLIVVDTAIGSLVGNLQIFTGSIRPGAAMGGLLPYMGDVSVIYTAAGCLQGLRDCPVSKVAQAAQTATNALVRSIIL